MPGLATMPFSQLSGLYDSFSLKNAGQKGSATGGRCTLEKTPEHVQRTVSKCFDNLFAAVKVVVSAAGLFSLPVFVKGAPTTMIATTTANSTAAAAVVANVTGTTTTAAVVANVTGTTAAAQAATTVVAWGGMGGVIVGGAVGGCLIFVVGCGLGLCCYWSMNDWPECCKELTRLEEDDIARRENVVVQRRRVGVGSVASDAALRPPAQVPAGTIAAAMTMIPIIRRSAADFSSFPLEAPPPSYEELSPPPSYEELSPPPSYEELSPPPLPSYEELFSHQA